MSTELFDVFVREGFQTHFDRKSQLQVQGDIYRYSHESPFAEVATRFREGSSPYVVLIDEVVNAPLAALKCVEDYVAGNSDFGAITFASDGLKTVFGRNCVDAQNKSDSTRKQHVLTPWMCVLDRRALLNALNSDSNSLSEFQSLEFFLFGLAQFFDESGFRIVQLDEPGVVFDTRAWCSDRIFQSVDALIHDYSVFIDTNPEQQVRNQIPPQFRLQTSHRYIPTPNISLARSKPGNRPKFSVICPVFKADFLEEMLQSVLDQNFQDWELLMIIDGPPEAQEARIVEILERHDDPRITWRRQKNRGTGPTRRSIAEMATGEFVLSIDDDDMLASNTLEVFSAAVSTHPEIRCFRGGAQLIGMVDDYLRPQRRVLINGLANDPFEVTQPYVVERETLESLGGYEWDDDLHKAGEDTYLFHKLDEAGVETGLIDLPLYFRRLSTKNLSLRFELEEALAHFRNLDQRFCPTGWESDERRFEMLGNFERATAVYIEKQTGIEIATSTQFFQFQNLGDLSEVTIDLEVTSACNADCGFCPRDVMPDRKRMISMEHVERLAEQIRVEPSKKQVVLCGIGESTLHPELDQIVKTLTDAGAFLAMTTNGSRMNTDRFRQLVDLGLLSFNFSLNAASAETHRNVMRLRDYDGIVRNLCEILEYRKLACPHIRVHVSFVVCTANEHEVTDFVEHWRSQNVSQVWLHPVNNRAGLVGANLKAVDLNRFASLYEDDDFVSVDIFRGHAEEENLCKIARSLIFISADGEMRLCAMDYQRITSYGNLMKKSLQQMHFEKLRSFIRGETGEFCSGCDFCPTAAVAQSPQTEFVPLLPVL